MNRSRWMPHILNHRDASKPSEKKEKALPKKRGRKTKEEQAAYLAEQAKIEANLTTYEKTLVLKWEPSKLRKNRFMKLIHL